MALFPLNAVSPLGQFDLLDTELASILGGEVLTFTTTSRGNTATEQAAFDAQDGYLFDVTVTVNNRPALLRATTAAQFPLYLADDGTGGYGTLLGSLIGAPVGLDTAGSALGPSTAAASGKVTAWDKPGIYAVSIDAVASDFLTSVTTGAYGGLTPGTSIGFANGAGAGKLAHDSCTLKVAATGVAHFIEFQSAPTSNSMASLVTTPNKLIGATQVFNRVVINYHAGMGVRTL